MKLFQFSIFLFLQYSVFSIPIGIRLSKVASRIAGESKATLLRFNQIRVQRADLTTLNILNKNMISQVEPIPVTGMSQHINTPTMDLMRRFANQLDGAYRGSIDPSINAWIDLVKAADLEGAELTPIKSAFATEYNLDAKDIKALNDWTDIDEPIVSPYLVNALEKLPLYQGTVIRNTMLDADSLKILENGLLDGKLIPMNSFVKNKLPMAIQVQENIQSEIEKILAQITLLSGGEPNPMILRSEPANTLLATSAVGFDHFQPEEYNVRLVIKSRTGRMIMPISQYATEGEVVIHSMLSDKGFKVLGKGAAHTDFQNNMFLTDKKNYNVLVYFLEEY